MIRLLEALLSTLVYFLAAMALGGLCLFIHLWFAWKLTPEKIHTAVAAARGTLPPPVTSVAGPVGPKEPPEEPSYYDILEKRANTYRDLELKEKLLNSFKDELLTRETTLEKKEDGLKRREKTLEERVAQVKEEAENAGIEAVRRTLESLRPSQAKELIQEMLARNEDAQVVALLQGMNDSKRARIIGEFRTPEETAKIADILKQLREGPDLKSTQ
jgi:flagellar motility protein MotE (MotC chaperone)